jgi:hypothetical protein
MIRSSALSHVPARAVVLFTLSIAGGSWIGAAAPSLLPAVTYDAGGGATRSVVVTDVNGDGTADLVVALQNDPGGTRTLNGLVAVLLGNSDGSYAAATTYDSAGMQPFSLAVGDINGDSRQDIVVANFCNYVENTCWVTTLGLLLGHGDGTFAPAVPIQLGGNSASSVAIADLNNDGAMDIVATVLAAAGGGPSVEVLIGNGDATFRPSMFVGTADDDVRSVTVGDLNGDDAPDLVLTGNKADDGQSRGTVSILRGTGDGTFLPVVKYDSGVSPGGWANSAALADFNRDGHLDVAVANYPDDRVGVLLGNGDGTLQAVVLYDSGATLAWSVAAADVDGDGKPDVSVGNASGVIGVLAGNGDGTFGTPQAYPVPGVATSLAAADLNGDGKVDLVVSNGDRTVSVLLNGPLCEAVAPVVTISADPALLWPPSGKTVDVRVYGTITGSACALDGAGVTYAVSDEYGEVALSGPVALGADGSFSLVLRLPASRRGHDRDGRQYEVAVQARTVSGITSTNTATVTVAHDRRK